VDSEIPRHNPGDGRNGYEAGRQRPAFFGVKHGGRRAALISCAVIVIVGGACLALDRYYFRPRRMDAEASGEAEKRRLERWSRSPRGWERLFEKASASMPGYIVDVGRPARLKLVEVGPELRTFLERKLRDPQYGHRITAIQVLASIGEPRERVEELLTQELTRATERKHEVGVIKCATTVPDFEPVLAHICFAALDSPHAVTRRIAASYLAMLRTAPNAPPDLGERLAALSEGGDLKVRIELAMNLYGEDPSRTYRVLLEGLSSDDEETASVAANHVAGLREEGHPISDASTPEEIAEALEAHRTWLEKKLADAERAAEHVGRELICDACGEILTGRTITRAEAARYHRCAKCSENKARAVVYFMCLNEDCNGKLIQTVMPIPDEDTASVGDGILCSVCGQADSITPDPLPLAEAEKIAQQTAQDFP
jgi:hypothetical protein